MKRILSLLASLFLIAALHAQAPDKPRVLLLGDSIRLGYAPLVKKKLADVAEVIFPSGNGGDTANTLKHLDEWLKDAKPAIVHFNNGIHDSKHSLKDGTHQTPLMQYQANLRMIVERLRKETPNVVFATTTPIVDERRKKNVQYEVANAFIEAFNAKAVETMRDLKVPVHDLNALVKHYDPLKMVGPDGTHYPAASNEKLADAVADVIRRQLTIVQAKPRKNPAAGPEAEAAYKKAEAEQDAAVPDYFKKLKTPAFEIPKDKADWEKRRGDVKAKVLASLGDMPARPEKPLVELVSVERRDGFTLERIRLDNGLDGKMSAMLMIPDGLKKPAPAILWLHSSSYDHDQLLWPHSVGVEEPLGVTFMKQGYVVFAPDAAWYGDRAGAGPAGSKETTANQQASQLKFHLWFGRTLWGMFVRDDQLALDYLCTRPEVDLKKIGATGISMGSTRSWWLQAVDDRIACSVGVACLTRYENLIHHGQLKQHGVYYFVFGLLKHFDIEGVLSLIAPRPYLALTGDLDAGSPADGIKIIEEKLKAVYEALGAEDKFKSVIYPQTGHTYTAAMREEMLAWFAKWLK